MSFFSNVNIDVIPIKKVIFLLSIYDSNESIDFVHGKSKNFIEVKLFIDKKRSLTKIKISVGPPSVSEFFNPHNFFTFNLDTSPLQVKVY
jgi:hypothetical protein